MKKQWIIGNRTIDFSWLWKEPEYWTNRHGGGWAWKLGFCCSNPLRDIVIYLMWGSLRIRKMSAEEIKRRKDKKC